MSKQPETYADIEAMLFANMRQKGRDGDADDRISARIQAGIMYAMIAELLSNGPMFNRVEVLSGAANGIAAGIRSILQNLDLNDGAESDALFLGAIAGYLADSAGKTLPYIATVSAAGSGRA